MSDHVMAQARPAPPRPPSAPVTHGSACRRAASAGTPAGRLVPPLLCSARSGPRCGLRRGARARAAAGAQGPAGEPQGLAAPPAQPADHGQDPEAGQRGHRAHELMRRAGLGFGIGWGGGGTRVGSRGGSSSGAGCARAVRRGRGCARALRPGCLPRRVSALIVSAPQALGFLTQTPSCRVCWFPLGAQAWPVAEREQASSLKAPD
jgi:hypothetical protein